MRNTTWTMADFITRAWNGFSRMKHRLPVELGVINPDLVVIDTGGMAAGGTIDESLVAAFWNTLAAACPKEAAVLVITHPTKQDSPTAMGSQLWTSRSREIYETKDDQIGPSSVVTISDVKLKIVQPHSYEYTFNHGAIEVEKIGYISEETLKKMGYKDIIYQTLRQGALTRVDLWQEIKEQDDARVKTTFESAVSRALKQGPHNRSFGWQTRTPG